MMGHVIITFNYCFIYKQDVWLKTASVNTKLFEEAFSCIPTDRVKTMAELQVLKQL